MISRYKEYFRSKDSYETECHHLAVIENHFGKDRIISRITLADAEEFRQGRVDAPHRLRGEKNPFRKRALSTVNREVECLRRLLNKAVDWRLLKASPVDASLLFDEPKGKISYLTAAQAGALLKAAQEEAHSNRRCKRNHHLYGIILTALETGMRLGNVLNLRWDELDFGKRTIHLPDTKPGTSLNVPMSSRLADALSRVPRRLGSEYVFATSNGQAYKRIEKSFDRAKRKAGIPSPFRFHDLRHTFVSHALAQGVPIHVVARIVGHSTTRMTERYAHLIEGQEHDAVERLPEWKSAGKEGVASG